MELHWDIDHERQLFRQTISGVVLIDPFLKQMEAMYLSLGQACQYNVIADYRKAELKPQPEDVAAVKALTLKYMNFPAYTAIVVQESWNTMLVDLFAFEHPSQREYKVFYEYTNAEKWLESKRGAHVSLGD